MNREVQVRICEHLGVKFPGVTRLPGRNRGGYPTDEPVGQRRDKVEPAVERRRRYSFTRRTKVLADGTVRKIKA